MILSLLKPVFQCEAKKPEMKREVSASRHFTLNINPADLLRLSLN
jgi:hypothetical protein